MGKRKQPRQQSANRIQMKSKRGDNQPNLRILDEESFKQDLNKTNMIDHQAEHSLLAGYQTTTERRMGEQSTSFKVFKQRRQLASSRNIAELSCISFCYYYLIVVTLSSSLASAQQVASFPGVSRDLASFCSARPSLSIDLASMVVHVKRTTSFNYKLYLFSSDNYVFQTGQIVPRDDFRIHSFPVKLKPFNEFFPVDVPTYRQTISGTLAPVMTSKFNAKAFFSQVPINPGGSNWRPRSNKRSKHFKRHQRELQALKQQARAPPTFDVPDHGDILPGDETAPAPFGHHDVALAHERNTFAAPNLDVHFDRDDQVAVLGARSPLHDVSRRATNANPTHSASLADRLSSRSDPSSERISSNFAANQQLVMPVGAFSSFHVNTTYLVRKDFDQSEAELVRLTIDPNKFSVTQVDLLDSIGSANVSTTTNATQLDDHAFLKHKLLSDPNTRITSINQIYEDWITRNFYTIVYIQRRLEAPERARAARSSKEELDEMDELSDSVWRVNEKDNSLPDTLIVTDRLIFRGSSVVLLGADQLDYEVKASAFITEKNGLHYYFEFLTQGKFYLGAIDWSRRPFAIIDAQRFPVRQTKTKFDNEELLLCPPSVCYSERPIDELVSYGRLGLAEKFARQAAVLTRALSAQPERDLAAKSAEVFTLSSGTLLPSSNRTVDEQDHELTYAPDTADKKQQQQQQILQRPSDSHQMQSRETGSRGGEMISLHELIDSARIAASQLELRLHLRDWAWTLPRVTPKLTTNKMLLKGSSTLRNTEVSMTLGSGSSRAANGTAAGSTETSPPMSAFAWHFERARRNDIKVTADTYGFVLTGHEIDASYRVYDELHLISANHLITINYTLANETVTSAQPIGDEFQGLSSSLLDPITGAFYDRYANQLYFFKGDRYVGYDYATKKPLEDFLLPPPLDALMVAPNGSPLLQAALGDSNALPIATRRQLTQPLVSSLPVVGILGRQHYVDAIWHDLHEDLVYVFAGAKFYAFHASEFMDGAFKTARQPALRCINEHFLDGCRFDEAFPNPCHEPDSTNDMDVANEVEVEANQRQQAPANSSRVESKRMKLSKPAAEFNEEQQMKLRSIAAHGGGLFDVLFENTLAGASGDSPRSALEPFLLRAVPMSGAGLSTESTPQERIVIYLLIAMVLITILVTVAMIVVILNWGQAQTNTALDGGDTGTEKLDDANDPAASDYQNGEHSLHERIAYPPAISQYLTNQYHHHQLQQPLPYQQQYARRQQIPLNFLAGSPVLYHTSDQGVQVRRQSQPQPSQSRLVQSLNQMAKAAAPSPNRSTAKRYDNLANSSAL